KRQQFRRKRPLISRIARIALFSLGSLVGLLAVGVGVLVLFFSWNDLRGVVAERTGASLGRSVAIEGNLHVDHISMTPRVRIEGLKLGNPDWAKEAQLASFGAVEFTIRLGELLRGRVVLPELIFEQPKVALEKGPDGAKTWSFSENPAAVAVSKV